MNAKKLPLLLVAAATLLPLGTRADEIRLTMEAEAVGTTKLLALNDGLSATLTWDDGTQEQLRFTGMPQSVVVKGTALTITTAGKMDVRFFYAPDWDLTSVSLTAATGLRSLNLSNNRLTSLTVTRALTPYLEELIVRDNRLTTLTLIALPNLTVVDCANNEIATLNAQYANNLQSLVASGNKITSFTATSPLLRTLWLNDNALTTLNASAYANLRCLVAHNNALTTYTPAAAQPYLTDVWVDGNDLTALDLSQATAIATVSADDNNLQTITYPGGVAKTLTNFYVVGNQLPFKQLPTVYNGKVLINSLIEAQDSLALVDFAVVNEPLRLTDYFRLNAVALYTRPDYVVKTADGTQLGTDAVTQSNGVFTFLKPMDDVFVEVTSRYYPGVTLRTKAFNVTLTNGIGAVTDASGDGRSITTRRGTLTVTTARPTEVVVYDAAGRLVVKEKVSGGSTDFALPEGIYVVAGKKVLVP